MTTPSGIVRIFSIFLKIVKYFLIFLGILSLAFCILCFTHLPWLWIYRLGTSNAGIHRPPDFIVIMGGGGMPSESALIRTYYAANLGHYYPRARIIVTLPGDTSDPVSSINLMKKELVLRGISPGRILLEAEGTNTRAEALNVQKIILDLEASAMNNRIPASSEQQTTIRRPLSGICLVTSPEHMYRSVLSFRKVGFLKVDGLAAFANPIEAGLTYEGYRLGGRDWMIPDVGNNLMIRYQFWLQARNLGLAIRECIAMGYYRMKGWI
jgi:uncharacterized SAM-binding protein YcdF (DUF218 family)